MKEKVQICLPKQKKKKKRRSKSLKRKKEKMAKDYPENNTIVSSQARSIQEVNKAKCKMLALKVPKP